jgi:hypothetical protein
MRALVVYESMFGNTRTVAEAIAGALTSAGVTTTVTTAVAARPDAAEFDLVVVGAPTHAHTLPQASSRAEAAAWAGHPEKALTLESSAGEQGVREWLKELGSVEGPARFAAFATRVDMPRIFTGDASRAIAKRLRDAGVAAVDRECFLVSSVNVLLDGEAARAAEWAGRLAAHGLVAQEAS